MWYSFNVGIIHFVAISTDYIEARDQRALATEREWLIHDLEQAQADRHTLLSPFPSFLSDD